MATIKEDYCSQEVYRLLIEKGFDGEIHTTYDKEGYTQASITLQIAMKWLREVHNWTICISPYWPEGDMRNKLTWYYDIHSLIDNRSFRESGYTDNYTEACEAAIKYSLENLI